MVKVIKEKKNKNSTDAHLQVKSYGGYEMHDWNGQEIVDALTKECGLKTNDAMKIAEDVYQDIISMKKTEIEVGTLKNIVNYHLLKNGFNGTKLQGQINIGMSLYDLDHMIKNKSEENSNVSNNNPEAVALAITENSLKKYALKKVFSKDIGEAHLKGMIHLHDLGQCLKFYCGSHSLRAILKYGLGKHIYFESISKPAQTAQVAIGHLNTFMCSIASYFAGAIGIDYVNVHLAPYLERKSFKEMKQIAQYLIFSLSQSAFSRGGQSLNPKELIWIKEEGKYKSVEIGNFVDNIIENADFVKISDKYEIVNTDSYDIETISFKKTGEVEDKNVRYVARMPHNGKMYKIHTTHGIVDVTGDHSLFSFKGKNNIVPTKASEMKTNDFVVVPHKITIKDTKFNVDMMEYVNPDNVCVYDANNIRKKAKEKYGIRYGKKMNELFGMRKEYIKECIPFNKVKFSIAKNIVNYKQEEIVLKGDSQEKMSPIINLDYDFGYMVGMFVSEGHNYHKKSIISNRNETTIKNIENYLNKINYKCYRITKNDRFKNNKGKQRSCGNIEIGGILGYFINQSCSENGIKIIPSYIIDSCDSCVEGFLKGFWDGDGLRKRNTWAGCNTSKKVISGLSLLLLRSERESAIFESKRENENWNDCFEIRESKRRRINPFTEHRTITSFNEYYNHINKKTREDVEWFNGTDLSLARIKKIEEYDYNGFVYDISVPETEAFLGGTGNVFFKNTLFSDLNMHICIPDWLAKVKAIGPGGVELERTLGSYEKTAREFLIAMLEVYEEGDANGMPFAFPKCDLHLSERDFIEPEAIKIVKRACEVSSKNGGLYFVFDHDSISLSACCFTGKQNVLIKSGEGAKVRLVSFEEIDNLHHTEKTNLAVFHNGSWNKTKFLKLSGKDKKMYKIITTNKKEQVVTEDHIVPTLNGDKFAKDITNDDYLLFNTLSLNDFSKPDKHKLTYEQGVIIGAYLGDGSSYQKKETHTAIVQYSLNERDYGILFPLITKGLKDCEIDAEIKLTKIQHNVYPVYISSTELRDFIKEWTSGGYAYEKELNLNCLKESKEFRQGIIDGMYITDGGNSNRIYSISKKLIDQMECVFTSLGMQTVIDCFDRREEETYIRGEKVNHNYLIYSIRWFSFKTRRIYPNHYIFKNNSLYYKVNSIEELPEEDYVYCFEIDEKYEPYFTLPSGIITHNCRLRSKIDSSVLETPELIKFCGVQNVTINLPQCAYRSGKDEKKFFKEVKNMMDLVVKAHIQKKKHLETISEKKGSPLYELGKKPYFNGEPYVNLDKGTYIIGFIGINEVVKHLYGKELHEDKETHNKGKLIIAYMYNLIGKYKKEHGLKFSLEESPAESASRRLAKCDWERFEESHDLVKGNKETGDIYYCNSCHYSPDAPISFLDRHIGQAEFHNMIESGAITHMFCGEKTPSPESLYKLLEKTFKQTNCAQMTVSPEFTTCYDCSTTTMGLKDKCPNCGSERVDQITRIVGYYSRVRNWNDSKKEELNDRHKGNYVV